MDIATIQGEVRATSGRNANTRLRKRGLVPAVIYGHGEAPELVSLSQHDLKHALAHTAHVVRIKVGNEETQYLLKDVQYDHLQKDPLHVDLMRVDVTERVQVKVPVKLVGTPAGISTGGSLLQIIGELQVDCLLMQIPNEIRIRVDHLELEGSLHVRDLPLPEDVKALHQPEDIVCIVQAPRGTTEATLAAVAEGAPSTAEPEIIKKGKEEDEEGV